MSRDHEPGECLKGQANHDQVNQCSCINLVPVQLDHNSTPILYSNNIFKFLTTYRLSGILHVLYKAMDICLTTDTPTSDSEDGAEASASSFGGPSLQSPGVSISEEEAQMAVSLTEYFQEQRRVYEHVCCLCFCVLNWVLEHYCI